MSEIEDFFDVEEILDKKYNAREGKNYYLVKWEGYPPEQNTWEPEENLETIPDLVDEFEKKYQKKLRQNKKQREEKLNKLKSARGKKEKLSSSSSASLKICISTEVDTKPAKPVHSKLKHLVPKLAKAMPDRPKRVTLDTKETDAMEIDTLIPTHSEAAMDIDQTGIRVNTSIFNHSKVKGSLKEDTPAKIVGCRRVENDILYVVMFNMRKDGVIPEPRVYSQNELKTFAPKLLTDYWLENAVLA
jgi:hypothetical protein